MLFPRKSTFNFNHWHCIVKYATCLESGQYAHICRSFMYNITFEALFLMSKYLRKATSFVRKQWRHTAVSVWPHIGAFAPLVLIIVHKSHQSANNSPIINHSNSPIIMQYVILYSTIKSEIYGTHWTIKRPIPPAWSVDYTVPSHLALATFICTLFNPYSADFFYFVNFDISCCLGISRKGSI